MQDQSETKKEWQEPRIVVLLRSKPEEAVLGSCKALAAPPWGPQNNWGGCNQNCGAVSGDPCSAHSES